MFRIAIDISAFSAPHHSGVGEYILNLLENLFQIDQDNQYILFYNSARRVEIPKFNYKNVRLIKFHYPNKLLALSSYFLKYPKIDHLIEKRVGPIDLYFLPRLNYFPFSKSAKKILLIHDLSFKIFPHFFTLKDHLLQWTINLGKNIHRYDRLIAISENTKRDIISFFGYPAEKISILYPGLSKDFHLINNQRELGEVKSKYHLPDHFIFYLGNLEPRKNLISLILAFDQLEENPLFKSRDLKLIIAGASTRLYQNLFKISRKISAKGGSASGGKNSKQVIFLGYIPAKDRSPLYNLASVFVYPSFYEGFGLPPLEAMTCGCPVITSNNSSLPEVVGEAGLMVDPYNLIELKEAIWQVLTNQILRNRLIQKGINQAEKFDWQKTAKQLLKIFKAIA